LKLLKKYSFYELSVIIYGCIFCLIGLFIALRIIEKSYFNEIVNRTTVFLQYLIVSLLSSGITLIYISKINNYDLKLYLIIGIAIIIIMIILIIVIIFGIQLYKYFKFEILMNDTKAFFYSVINILSFLIQIILVSLKTKKQI